MERFGMFSFLVDMFFPPRCASCKRAVKSGDVLCEKCKSFLTPIEPPVCNFCGKNVLECECETSYITLSNFAAVYEYKGAVRKAIHQYKFDGVHDLTSFFGEKMAQVVVREWDANTFDFVCCVPVTKDERKERQYVPSEQLACEISELLGLEYRPDALMKNVETQRQHTLGAAQRLTNLKDAFSARDFVRGKTVLLCDDIKTTGATLRECCKALENAGAERVYCICIAISGNSLRY